jgi:hypothetical protein
MQTTMTANKHQNSPLEKMVALPLMLKLKSPHPIFNNVKKGNAMENNIEVSKITEIITPADNSIVLKGFTKDEAISVNLTREQCLQIIELALMTMGIGNETKALVMRL